MRTLRRRGQGLAVAALLVGCGGETATTTPTGPTYHGDVAPILADHCLGCHGADGIGPLSLHDYASASNAAAAVADATREGRMPPFHALDDGSCRSFVDGPTISDEQIATLSRWAEAGAPEGEPIPPPMRSAGPELREVSAVLDPGADYLPGTTEADDDYRCFIVDPKLDQDRFLVAYRVDAGVPRAVHHVVLYAVADTAEAAEVQALDDADPGLGYRCYGGPGTAESRSLAAWAPGTQATRYPEGTGLRLLADLPLVMQVHYSRGGEPDRTTMALELTDTVAEEAIITGVFDVSLELPPGQASVSQTAALPLPPLDKPLRLYGIYPHMHGRGRSVQAFVDRGGDSTCLIDVPRYDDQWQRFYFYDEAVVVPPPGGGFFRIACDFDTRGLDSTLHWGEDADDEMCIAAIYATY
ncbi:MAG: hypothetical protein R3B72_09685 [Polyangiaceae bacterium]